MFIKMKMLNPKSLSLSLSPLSLSLMVTQPLHTGDVQKVEMGVKLP